MIRSLLPTNIKHFKQLESTNQEAEKWLLQECPPEGSVILADFQTLGQGLGNNTWESQDKMNLLLSTILYPEFLAAEDQFMLNKIISLAVKDGVESLTQLSDLSIKWPNDIYSGKQKIAGILSKNSISGHKIQHTIVGIGLNINQISFSDELPNPASLKSLTGQSFDIKYVMKEVMTFLDKYYGMLQQGEIVKLDELYLDSLLNFNQEAKYKQETEVIKGTILNVSRFGQLIMRVNGATKSFDMKEIRFLFD